MNKHCAYYIHLIRDKIFRYIHKIDHYMIKIVTSFFIPYHIATTIRSPKGVCITLLAERHIKSQNEEKQCNRYFNDKMRYLLHESAPSNPVIDSIVTSINWFFKNILLTRSSTINTVCDSIYNSAKKNNVAICELESQEFHPSYFFDFIITFCLYITYYISKIYEYQNAEKLFYFACASVIWITQILNLFGVSYRTREKISKNLWLCSVLYRRNRIMADNLLKHIAKLESDPIVNHSETLVIFGNSHYEGISFMLFEKGMYIESIQYF